MMDKQYQLLWWGLRYIRWPLLAFIKFDLQHTDLALIYKWSLSIGPLELRKWQRG